MAWRLHAIGRVVEDVRVCCKVAPRTRRSGVNFGASAAHTRHTRTAIASQMKQTQHELHARADSTCSSQYRSQYVH